MIHKNSFVLSLVAALALAASANAAVSSWLSTVNAVGGGFAPGNGVLNLDINSSPNGSLYLWLRNDAVLQSVAYNLSLGTGGIAKITAVEVFQADISIGGNDIGDRWNLPLANGTINGDQQSVTNFSAVNVNANGLGVGTKSFDTLFDAAANAALFARIDFMALGLGSTGVALSEGSTLIVENSVQPPLTFGSAMINVTGEGGGDNTPPVGVNALIDNVFASTLIQHPFDANDAEDPDNALVWSDLQFAGLPGFGGTGVPNLAPMLGADGAFSWNTLGSARGVYTATATVTDTGGLTGTAVLTINVTQVPEPTTFGLAGLALVGIVGLIRRRS